MKWRLVGFTLLVAVTHTQASPLSLESYLAQVRQKHLGAQAARTAAEGAQGRAEEGTLLFSPQLFAESGWLDDRKQQLSPATMGTRQQAFYTRLGLTQQTRFGLKARLFTELNGIRVTGVNPAFLPQPKLLEGKHTLELSQSFLRNSFGSEARAMEDLLTQQAQAKSHAESFREKTLFAQAEATYWKLVAARQTEHLKAESLSRAVQLRDWHARRARLELGRKSDLLQAEAAVKLAELDLQLAKNEARAAATEFNLLRSESSDAVEESLEDFSIPVVLPSTGNAAERGDVQAAEKATRAAQAQAELALEKHRPSLDLSAAVTLNGRDPIAVDAYANAFSTHYPTLSAQLKLVVPLGKKASVNEGYRKEAAAAELHYRQKRLESETELRDLRVKFEEAQERLRLAAEIERAQGQKYLEEKRRHELGASTAYQVLTFEQDYTNAQVTRLKLEADLRTLAAHLKLFGGQS